MFFSFGDNLIVDRPSDDVLWGVGCIQLQGIMVVWTIFGPRSTRVYMTAARAKVIAGTRLALHFSVKKRAPDGSTGGQSGSPVSLDILQ